MVQQEAWNSNRDEQLGYDERYERADEFVDVVKKLWDSWEDDAFIRNKKTGVFYDEAADIVDEMEAWFKDGGCDGLNICPATLPSGIDDLVQLVIPELRRRGLFRKEYESST